jgi:hypothetical protein
MSSNVRRDTSLEQAASARSHRLTGMLQHQARAKLALAARALLVRLASGSENIDLAVLVQQEVHSKFADLSSDQSDLLSFYVLAEVARLLSHQGELKGQLEGMNETSETISLRLQMRMDRRSKFISTLSNIMKKVSATQNGIVQNFK